MMKNFIPFTRDVLNTYVHTRYDLTSTEPNKLEDDAPVYGNIIEICEDLSQLASLEAAYLIIGIPEDIGVRANMGRPGAHEAWHDFIKHFLNLPDNLMCEVNRFCILGHIATQDLMQQCEHLDARIHADRILLSNAVEELDERVSSVVSSIFQAKKIPVIIGGGHNNCYPILRSAGFLKPVDCINVDAHSDLRPPKGRHSGNGFSHAFKDGYLKSYAILGLQEQQLNQNMMHQIMADSRIQYVEFFTGDDDLDLEDVEELFLEIDTKNFGLEVDLDVVANFPSSAQSPVGISFEHLRDLVSEICSYADPAPKYIHFCEAAPRYGYTNQVGKALATLINDLPFVFK